MNETCTAFDVGSLYSNEEIFRSLEVGNAGGVRVRANGDGQVRRAALFTSIPTPRQLLENPYVDRLEDNVLVYTGTGRSGDQNLSGPNARLQQQPDQRFPIYGFAQIASRRSALRDNKRWQFLGLLDFLRCYREQQVDAEGQWRSVWVFELFVHNQTSRIAIASDRVAAESARERVETQLRPLDREVSLVSNDRPPAEGLPDLAVLEPTRKKLLALAPRGFELFVRDLLQRSGFERVEVTKFSQDGGIDVNARPGFSSWPIRHLLIQIQAKRWLHTVGRKEVAELRGSLQPHAAGCIVTTSHFSRAALQESQEPGKVPIAVIDGYELAHWTQQAKFPLP